MNDFRFAFRQLLKNPGFTAIAVLTLALGIGATTAIFSAVYGVLISPYPYAKPGEIWVPGLRSSSANQIMRPYRLPEYLEMTKLPAFAEVMATAPEDMLLTGEFTPENLRTVRVTGNAFDFLGVPPILGRTLGPSDIRAGGETEPVVVLSYQLWQRLFGGRPGALGKTLRLNDQLYTIIGVMPPRFGWWTSDGCWVPMGVDSRDPRGVFPIARLKPGVPPAVAREQWHGLQLQLARENPSRFPKDGFTSTLTNYLDITVASGEMQTSLRLLLAAVGFLLLIACANVANLQLARATARTREMAIRLCLGARRVRLLRQLLIESVLLSLAGGLLGLLFSVWITQLMVALMPSYYVPNEARIEVNQFVLLFCVIVSALTGILFGLAPALQFSRPDLMETLKEESPRFGSAAGGKARALLVVAEVALAVVLLVSAALTLRSFVALQQADLGFRPEHVITVDLTLPQSRYATLEQRNRFANELLQRVERLPGVRAAEIGNGGLPFGGAASTYSINGQSGAGSVNVDLVSEGYLDALGIPLQRGRMLDQADIRRADRFAVINVAAAKLWPAGADPLGRKLQVDVLQGPVKSGGSVFFPTNSSAEVTVVGICADAHNEALTRVTRPAVFVPYTLVAPPARTLAIRTEGDSSAVFHAALAQVQAMDKELPLGRPRTIQEQLGLELMQPRFIMALFTMFAALGLALAMAGVYGVLAYLVARRTREIGVRMALGAQRADVLRLILKTGGRLVGAGLLIGLPASLAVARLLSSQLELFRVSATDPVAFGGVVLVLGAVGLLACWLPARRAAKVDPMEALRCE